MRRGMRWSSRAATSNSTWRSSRSAWASPQPRSCSSFRCRREPRASTGWARANAVIIAAYTLVDAAGARASGSPLSYVVWLFVLDALPFPLMVYLARRAALVEYAARHWVRGLVGGALSAVAYAIALWAMTRAPVAAVAALRETSVIFAALIGAWLLKEGHVVRRLASALVVVAGVVALKL